MADFVRNHKKGVKIFLIVFLSLAVLVSGALIAFNVIMGNLGKSPEVQSATDDFEYETYGSLKNAYTVPEEEQGMTIDDYGNDKGFEIYRRAYSKFLSQQNYYVVTEGYTNAGGVYVNVNNTRKFDGTNFYMHMKSLARDQSIFSAASNNNAEHFLYITDNANNNLATIKKLDPMDDTKLKGEKLVLTEKDYVFNYGNLPYAVCVYTITRDTIESYTFAPDAETGLYKLSLKLNAPAASVKNIKQMYAVSGVKVSYDNGKIDYCVYMDADFIIRKITVAEEYSVTAIGITMSADAGLSDNYYYPGDEKFAPMTDAEKYDERDIPVKVDAGATAAMAELAKTAINGVAESGVNADFELEVDGMALDGRLQIALGRDLIIEADITLGGQDISLHIERAKDNSGNLILTVNGTAMCVEYSDLGKLINRILNKVGVSLPLNIGTMIDSLDLKTMVKSLASGKGRETENGTVYSSNINAMGIPFDLPVSYTVRDGRVVRFAIEDREINGTKINLVLTPSEKEFSAVKRTTENCCDLTEIVGAIFGKDSPIGEIIETESVGCNLSGSVAGYDLNGSAVISLGDEIKVSVALGLGDFSIGGYFENDTIYLCVDDLAVKATIATIKDYLSAFGFDLGINADGLIETLAGVIANIRGVDGGMEIALGDFAVAITADGISLTYSDIVDLTVNGFNYAKVQSHPDKNYLDLSGIKPLFDAYLPKLEDIISKKAASFNLDLDALGISADLGVCVDFSDGISASAVGSVFGKDISAFYTGGEIFLCIDGARFAVSLESVKEYISLFVGELPDIGDLDVDKIITTAIGVLSGGAMDNGAFTLNAFGVDIKLSGSGITVSVGDSVNISVSDIGRAPLSEKPAADYQSLDGLGVLLTSLKETLLPVIDRKTVGAKISAVVSGYEVNGEFALDFNDFDDLKLSAIFTVKGITVKAYLSDGVIYADIDGLAYKISLDSLGDYASIFGLDLDGFDFNISDLIFGVINGLTVSGDSIGINYGDISVAVSVSGINFGYGDLIIVSLSGINAATVENPPQKEYTDLAEFKSLISAYKPKVENIISQKTVAFNLDGNALDYDLSFEISVGFDGGISLSAEGVALGKEIRAYFDGEKIYACISGANFEISLSNLKDYITAFVGELPAIGDIDTDRIIALVIGLLKDSNIENGVFTLDAFGVNISIAKSGITVVLNDKLNLTLSDICTRLVAQKPVADYITLDGLGDLITAVKEPILSVIDSKTVGAKISGVALGMEISGEFALDFNDLENLKLSALIYSKDITVKAYLVKRVVYADINGLTYKISLDRIADYADLFGINLNGDFSVSDIIFDALKGISVSGNRITLTMGDISAAVSPSGIDIAIGDKLSFAVSDIAPSAVGELPAAAYKDLAVYKRLVGEYARKIFDILENESVSASLSGSFGDIDFTADFRLEFSSGIKLSVNATVGDNAIDAYLDGDRIYIVSDIMCATLSLSDLRDYISVFAGDLQIDLPSLIPTIVAGLKNSSFTGGAYSVEIAGVKATVTADRISVEYGDISAAITNIGTQKANSRPQIKYTELGGLNGLLSAIKQPVTGAIESKRIGATFDGELLGISVSGEFAVDFSDIDDLKAQATLIVDGTEIALYYDGRFYITIGELAITFDLKTVLDYAGIFTEVPQVNPTDLFSEVLGALSSLTVKDGGLSLSVKGVLATVSADGIAVKYKDKTDISVREFTSGTVQKRPQRTYKEISGLETLLEKIKGQLENRYFNFEVSARIGSHTLTLKNIKVENQGDLKNPSKAFDDGLLRLSGTVVIDGKLTVGIVYANKTLYASISGINLSFDRSSLDYMVDILLKKGKDVLRTFNYSDIIKEGLFKKLGELDLGTVIAMLCGLNTDGGGITLQIDASNLDLGTVVLNAAVDSKGNLCLGGTIGNSGSLSVKMNNDAFVAITKPSGSYINLSNSKYLVEGFVNAVLKKEEAYYLDGSASINLTGDLGLSFGLTASVRFVDIVENGVVSEGKDVEAVITLNNTDKFFGELVTEAILQSYIKYGTATICIKRGIVYIERTDYKYSWYTMNKGDTYRRKMTTAYFAKTAMDQLSLFFGLTDKITEKFSSSSIVTEGLIKSFTGSATSQKVVINGKNIDSALDENMPLTIGITERTVTGANGESIREKQLTSISSQFDIVSILTANINFTHHLDKTGNYGEIGQLNSKYASIPLLVA